MSLTDEITNTPINQVVATETGITEANLKIKSLSIKAQTDGSKSIFIQHNENQTLFTLTQKECDHLAMLLIE